MIEPVFERLAHERTQAGGAGSNGGVAFVKIDLGAGMGGMVGSLYSVRVTPTFIFFRDGNKVSGNCVFASPSGQVAHDQTTYMQTHEMRGVNAAELESQVNLLLWETYPRTS